MCNGELKLNRENESWAIDNFFSESPSLIITEQSYTQHRNSQAFYLLTATKNIEFVWLHVTIIKTTHQFIQQFAIERTSVHSEDIGRYVITNYEIKQIKHPKFITIHIVYPISAIIPKHSHCHSICFHCCIFHTFIFHNFDHSCFRRNDCFYFEPK